MRFAISSGISIHAPTRGATTAAFIVTVRLVNFNPRSHERSDQGIRFQWRDEQGISIHAPTRGATLLYAFCYILRNFNPRSHERSDSFIRIRFPGLEYFNPRSHERSDQSACPCSRHSRNFNPRSHERSDRLLVKSIIRLRISIHAPTRGATSLVKVFPYLFLFQSTLPREERL